MRASFAIVQDTILIAAIYLRKCFGVIGEAQKKRHSLKLALCLAFGNLGQHAGRGRGLCSTSGRNTGSRRSKILSWWLAGHITSDSIAFSYCWGLWHWRYHWSQGHTASFMRLGGNGIWNWKMQPGSKEEGYEVLIIGKWIRYIWEKMKEWKNERI
jgi:hypothetical protein